MKAKKKYITMAVVSLAAGTLYYSAVKESNFINDIRSMLYNPLKFQTCSFCTGYEEAVRKSNSSIRRVQVEMGIPGVVVGVSVNGKNVWTQGFGMANVETQTACNAKTKMRIASISKPITVGLLGLLMESGKIDIDQPVQFYVPYFPQKVFDGRPVKITTRMIASHTSGVRHYKKPEGGTSEWDSGAEFYLKERFQHVKDSVALFKEDALLFEPGKGFEYTTHGYTLLSAAIEGACKRPFTAELTNYLKVLGLTETHLDEVPRLVYGRASYYARDKNGKLTNAELTDNSYKWAGGGLVSTVGDLLKFGNMMLYSYQGRGFLKKETVNELWTGVEGTKMSWGVQAKYGLGWTVVPKLSDWQGGDGQMFHVGHGGGAVGASSVLILFPPHSNQSSGVVVAIIANLQNCSLYNLGTEVAHHFLQHLNNNDNEEVLL